jgi:hypothetical protein
MTREEYRRRRAAHQRRIEAELAAKRRGALNRAICIYSTIAAAFVGILIAIFTGHL